MKKPPAPGKGNPSVGWPRREFLKTSAAAVLGLTLTRLPAMAGPFTRREFDHLVPADKKLTPEWVKSLFERGEPEVLRGSELKYVGMPVGGLLAGHLYLGGDGRLWHWDIFNQYIYTTDKGPECHYVNPMLPASPLTQKFTLKIGDRIFSLDRDSFAEVSFRGEYPIGVVNYADPAVPLAVKLEAFSPFIPLNTDDSSLPATILQFTIRNPSAAPVEAALTGELENGVCLHHRQQDGRLRNRTVREPGLTTLICSAEKSTTKPSSRPDIVFEDWNKENYDGWKAEGTAFGKGPIKKSEMPSYQGDVGGDAARVVNSHATAPGDSIEAKDSATGRLISRDFVIERDFITFLIGGGRARAGSQLGMHLWLDGQSVLTASGQDQNHMSLERFDVRAYAGNTAHLEIVDDATSGWGNVGVGKIVFTDDDPTIVPLEKLSDFGTMCLAFLGDSDETSGDQTAPFGGKPVGSLGRRFKLVPGESVTMTFVIAWHFPNLSLGGWNPAQDTRGGPLDQCGRYYATKFSSAHAVAQYIAANYDRLAGQTRLWRDTWYDSTLPFWFLDRTFLNSSILATSTCHRFANGRFYGWEGVGNCPGTCGHVYQYAHAIARLFPDLERDLHERVDFGLAQQSDGAIRFRGEFNDFPAVDAQSGYILRALREHQISANGEFLRRLWPKIKLATQWLIQKDANGDGLIESNQHNTLDTDWYGKVAWLSGLYQAALVAATQMAGEVGDRSFADACQKILAVGGKNFVSQLFDGEYFINLVDPKHLDAINSGTGCEIDQVFGQSWAFQAGLPRVLPEKETVSALKSLWRYNFTPDVGPYRNVYKPGRWYAMPGEAGLLICTFPRTDWDYAQAEGKGPDWAAGYFNECMNGYEYEVAGHMIWEGMVMEGLAVTRAVHDRYHASRRNPWNEIECGDHYARSMASHGIYLAACGFEYHGPKGHIGFAPRLKPKNFKCAFTSAEGWGSFSQQVELANLKAQLAMKWGTLRLKTMALNSAVATSAIVRLDGKEIQTAVAKTAGRTTLAFAEEITLAAGQVLEINVA
jgi:uncharacterized protein (DUF608 family)